MIEFKMRCSSIGKIMTEPKLKSEMLSVGAKTHIRELVAQAIFGVDFEIGGKELEKGIRCEQESIDLLNLVRGTALVKNTERRSNEWITGECDLFHAPRRRGHDMKCSWSMKSFPLTVEDIESKALPLYTWQARGYMWLWDADEWEINWALINTPEDLIRFEPQSLHFMDHLPAHQRITTLLVERDAKLEAAMAAKVEHARAYFHRVVREFDECHQPVTAGNHSRPAAPAMDLPNDIFS